jgi:molybdopterin converting factor small subunit
MIMVEIALKIPAWLCQKSDTESVGFQVIAVDADDMETILRVLADVACRHNNLQTIVSEKTFGILLNGRFVNPYDPGKTALKEGDEITLIPLLDGG